jgi:hypothetical protein
MRLDEIMRAKRQEIMRIASRHGARSIKVFGSVVRGEAGPDSDVDLLVDLEPGRTLMDHVALTQDLEDILGCRVDVVENQALHRRIRDRVLSEAVAL